MIQRATQKDANGRFYSAHELREALEAVAQSRTGVFAAANRTGAFAASLPQPAPISAADFGGSMAPVGNSTMQYGAATQLGMAPPPPLPPPSGGAMAVGLAPIPVQTRGSYAWLWGGLGGAALVIIGFLLAKAMMAPQSTALMPVTGGNTQAPAPSGGGGSAKDPLDQFIDQAIGKKLGGGVSAPSGGSSGPTVAPQVRQASEQELREANSAIQNGQQLLSQGRYAEAAQQFYFAKERAVGTDVGTQAQRLYDDASSHTDLFGGAIKRGN